jgi:DNA-binding beta-propeller fold protein YncE
MTSRRPLLFAAAFLSSLVSVRACAQQVLATLPVSNGPVAAAVNPVTNKIYVLSRDSHVLTIIDGLTYEQTTLSVGSFPGALAVNSVTNKIYVVDLSHLLGIMTVIDGATLAMTTVNVGVDPCNVAVNQVTNKIYVLDCYEARTVTVVDGSTLATTTVPIGRSPSALVVNPVTNKIYVPNEDFLLNGFVTVIDGETLTTVTVPIGLQPDGAAVNSATNKIYVANQMGASVTVIDGVTNSTTTVPVGGIPTNVDVDALTNKIYVVNAFNVTVIDGDTLSTTDVPITGSPSFVAVNAVTNSVYVTASGANQAGTVTVINGANLSTTTLGIGHGPYAPSINTVTNRVYVPNWEDASVSVIAGAPISLSVSKSGSGKVSSNDGYIQCGSVCSHKYQWNTAVMLTALPAEGSTFEGWRGCDSTLNNLCGVTMNRIASVRATFAPVQVVLSSLTFDPPTVRAGKISIGTVTLGASAPVGGVTVGLTSSMPSRVNVPSVIYIQGGQKSARFVARTVPFNEQTTATITAVAGNASTSGTLKILP